MSTARPGQVPKKHGARVHSLSNLRWVSALKKKRAYAPCRHGTTTFPFRTPLPRPPLTHRNAKETRPCRARSQSRLSTSLSAQVLSKSRTAKGIPPTCGAAKRIGPDLHADLSADNLALAGCHFNDFKFAAVAICQWLVHHDMAARGINQSTPSFFLCAWIARDNKMQRSETSFASSVGLAGFCVLLL